VPENDMAAQRSNTPIEIAVENIEDIEDQRWLAIFQLEPGNLWCRDIDRYHDFCSRATTTITAIS
jgi:hypothetical protein